MSGPQGATLPERYLEMGQGFVDDGLNVASVASLLEWFDDGSQHADGVPRPKLYTGIDKPLPINAVRVLELPFTASNMSIQKAGEQITEEISELLKPHAQVFRYIPETYHVTVHHTSNPWDPRPVPMQPDGGTDVSLPASERAGPTAAELEAEVSAMRGVISRICAPTVTLERVLLANSGTLLLCWVDQGGMEEMRAQVWQQFPGSSKKQANIIHTSLARVVTASQIPPEVRQQVQDICERWTQQLRGTPLHCKEAWHTFEWEFTTHKGPSHILPFGTSTS